MRTIRLGVCVSVWALAALGAGCGDDTGTPPQACSSANCSGCCDSTGTCIKLSAVTASKCGIDGASCKKCAAGDSCDNGVCKSGTPTCGPANCPTGCCQNNQCMLGDDVTACGKGGGTCAVCNSGQTCGATGCVTAPCDATTCPTGCCMSNVCLPGTNAAACGTGGIACVDCGSGKQCNAQKQCESFQCGSATCPTGCCSAQGQCMAGTASNACGTGGIACVDCGSGKQCNATSRVCEAFQCNATTCPAGCCDKTGACVAGNADAACGKGGGACATCGSGQACQNQVCQNVTTSCNATTCPAGCCDKTGACVPGNADAACGTGGTACKTCGSGQTCANAKCVCNATSCAGCCSGDTCKAGSEDAFCGKSGAACTACTSPAKCLSGSCQVDCSFLTCTGCCDSAKVCHDPPNATNCGLFGNACSTCASGSTCSTVKGNCNNSATCSSSTCASGCCKNGTCQTGNQDAACGQKGSVCETCGSPGAPHLFCGIDPFYGSRECIATNLSQWDVMLDSVEVKSGVDWDDFLEGGDAPEIYVKLTVGGVTKQSPVAKEGYTATYNNAYLLTAKAADLATKIHFELWDSDNFGDDEIAKCDDAIYPAELKDGILTLTACGGQPNNANFISITFRLKVKAAQ